MIGIFWTPRLTARQFTSADVDDLHAICGDRRVMRYVGDGLVLTRQRCAWWIDESLVHYTARGYGAWALEVSGETTLAGYCGIVPARRRADPEIIYALRPGLWGRGLASELVPALLNHGFKGCRLPRVIATVRPENQASLRVVEKAGMHCAGEELAAEGILMLIYALDAPRP